MKEDTKDYRRVSAIISGRVQGVYYRESTRRQVLKIGGLTGWVKNQPDNTVKLIVEGNREKVQQLLDWCQSGPPMARVQSIDILEENYLGEFSDFMVRY
ncbi:MAG: acylphosphatase [Candidatus Marinimicrobia bacterium]|jgi:acylphosphatase|nr:acylphosphatase [Candidatus Neomarinimicrobiota bacterium]MBT3633252.1 acylphosphatase [Candidatus Neomarinimicrobiota bacterium]MBT3682147.1 acylphosphatase [Candidatus Neomarinimicrobiota bacterium]MBT3758852.1 acylphosphatase [Candidatus Neomarinimicrobiota bacterium]MBT3895273.1 acylphosphatase [Candidatus Neomarinimicrobiota bacterium]